MTARHCASPVRVPWSSTRLHRLRACISNLDCVSRIVTLTVTMSAESSRRFSRFPALSTISSLWGWRDLVQPFLAALAPAAALGLQALEGRPADDQRDKIAKPSDSFAAVSTAFTCARRRHRSTADRRDWMGAPEHLQVHASTLRFCAFIVHGTENTSVTLASNV